MELLEKTIIHFFLSIAVYFVIVFFIAKWIPFSAQAILISFVAFLIVYAAFWFGKYFYYKRVEVKHQFEDEK